MTKLSDGRVFATLAVNSMDEAKTFYGGTLGLVQVDENPGGVTYESGGSRLFVYESENGGTSQATSASWAVDGIEDVVKELKAAGVVFEHYDMPETEWQGDVAVWGGTMKAAWFKDPSGNILNVSSM